MTASPHNYTRADRLSRRAKLEAYGKCSRCRPHAGENAKRRNARKSKDRK